MHKPKSIFTKYVILTFLIALFISFMHFNPKEHIALIRRKIFKEAYDYRRKKTEMEYREELGRSTWALLHIMAAKYSYSPTDIEKKEVNDFIFLLAKVFPCIECKVHFSKMIQENPPQLDDHDSFVKWVCEIHNKVNVRLNKPVFDCRRHDERWDCGCNQ